MSHWTILMIGLPLRDQKDRRMACAIQIGAATPHPSQQKSPNQSSCVQEKLAWSKALEPDWIQDFGEKVRLTTNLRLCLAQPSRKACRLRSWVF